MSELLRRVKFALWTLVSITAVGLASRPADATRNAAAAVQQREFARVIG
jgi:hypothetical protein